MLGKSQQGPAWGGGRGGDLVLAASDRWEYWQGASRTRLLLEMNFAGNNWSLTHQLIVQT